MFTEQDVTTATMTFAEEFRSRNFSELIAPYSILYLVSTESLEVTGLCLTDTVSSAQAFTDNGKHGWFLLPLLYLRTLAMGLVGFLLPIPNCKGLFINIRNIWADKIL